MQQVVKAYRHKNPSKDKTRSVSLKWPIHFTVSLNVVDTSSQSIFKLIRYTKLFFSFHFQVGKLVPMRLFGVETRPGVPTKKKQKELHSSGGSLGGNPEGGGQLLRDDRSNF